MAKVLVVEDVSALRQHVTRLLKEKIDPPPEVIEAANGHDGLKLFRTARPDMIVMDISMPEMSGIKAAEQIWQESPATKILFWSQYHREAYVREIGKIVPDEAIHGYALKSETDEKLIYAITSVLIHNNPYIDPLVRGVQNRLSMLLTKLIAGEDQHLRDTAGMEIYNPRTRVIFEALKRQLIDPDAVTVHDDDLNEWLAEEFDYEKA